MSTNTIPDIYKVMTDLGFTMNYEGFLSLVATVFFIARIARKYIPALQNGSKLSGLLSHLALEAKQPPTKTTIGS